MGAGGRPGADERGGWGVLGGIFLVLVELPSGSEEAMEWLQSQDPPALHPGTTVNHNPITVHGTVNPNPNPRYQQWERPFVSVATTASDNQWEPHSLITDLRACVEASTVTLEIES